LLGALLPSQASAQLTPESPEVKALIAEGVQVLEKYQSEERLGALALYGLTLLKAESKPDHPLVQKALSHVKASRNSIAHEDVYTIGLCLIFLAEMDPTGNRAEIQTYLDHLLKIQKPHGGWGYEQQGTGDTSMTQYGVLSMWELARIGIPTPADPWERVSNWLLRTQDPSGAWGYQGTESPGDQLVQQSGVRHSMSSAGLGSLHICMDRFGGVGRGSAATSTGVPDVLKQVKKDDGRQFLSTSKVNFGSAAKAMQLGDVWMDKNYNMSPQEYTCYFLYAFERYQSFRELESGQPFSHPTWYDDGVAYLQKSKMPQGGWQRDLGVGPDTSFALLFLLRSSRKSIQKIKHLGAGTLVAGVGLPKEGEDLQVSKGRVTSKPLAGPAEQLLAAIEDPSSPDYLRAMESFDAKIAAAAPQDLDKMADRLRRLAGDDVPEARATAVRSLGRTRDMDNVPLLIAALDDPDPMVFGAAEESLRFLSRTFSSRGDDDEGELTPTRRKNSQKHWKNWYLSIRPNAKLEP